MTFKESIKEIKECVNIKETILYNWGNFAHLVLIGLYMHMTLTAVNNTHVNEMIQLPFIVIIAFSAVLLIAKYNIKVFVVEK